MEWRSVQDDRPSCSTSGGQSEGGPAVTSRPAVPPLVTFLVWEAQSAKEVQDRQLYGLWVRLCSQKKKPCTRDSRFPVLS